MKPAANGSHAGAPSTRKKARQKSAPSGTLTTGGAARTGMRPTVSAASATIAGPNTSTGARGDTRSARSTSLERESGGEARSLSVRDGWGESAAVLTVGLLHGVATTGGGS